MTAFVKDRIYPRDLEGSKLHPSFAKTLSHGGNTTEKRIYMCVIEFNFQRNDYHDLNKYLKALKKIFYC